MFNNPQGLDAVTFLAILRCPGTMTLEQLPRAHLKNELIPERMKFSHVPTNSKDTYPSGMN